MRSSPFFDDTHRLLGESVRRFVEKEVLPHGAVLAEELGRSGFGGFAVAVLAHTDMGLHGGKMFITNGALAELYFGRRLDKMGWRCSDTAELVLDGCAAELLGEEGRGFGAIEVAKRL